MSSGLNVLQPFGFHGFYLAIPCCFGSSLSAQSRSEKPQAGAGGVGLRYFASGTAWPKLEGKGVVGSCCCLQGIDFFERCNVNIQMISLSFVSFRVQSSSLQFQCCA